MLSAAERRLGHRRSIDSRRRARPAAESACEGGVLGVSELEGNPGEADVALPEPRQGGPASGAVDDLRVRRAFFGECSLLLLQAALLTTSDPTQIQRVFTEY